MPRNNKLKPNDIRFAVHDAIAHCNQAIDQFESYIEIASSQTQLAVIDNEILETAGEIVVSAACQQLSLSDKDVEHVSFLDVGKVLIQEMMITNYMPFIKNESNLAMPLTMLADQIPEFKTLILDRVPDMDIYPEINVGADAMADFRFSEINRRILSRGMQYVGNFVDSVFTNNHFIEHIATTHVLTLANTAGVHSIVSVGDMMALEYVKLAHSLAEYSLVHSEMHEINIPSIIDEVNHNHLRSLVKKIISGMKKRPTRKNMKNKTELYFMPPKQKYQPGWYGMNDASEE